MVIEHFKNNGWSYQLDPQHPLLHAGFKGQNGNFRLVVHVDESDDFVQVISLVPVVVPPEKMPAAAELIARLSFPMKIGNFELDCPEAAIRFRTYSAYPKGELKDEVIRRVVGVNLVMIDQNFPAFIKVIFGNSTPAEAAGQLHTRVLLGQQAHPEARARSRLSLN